MKPLGVVEFKIPPETQGKIRNGFVFIEVESLVLETPPQAFHEDVVESPAPAIHADSDIPFLQWSEEGLAGELASLVGIEDLRLSFFKGSGEDFNAKHCRVFGKLPKEDITAVPVDNGHRIHETSCHTAIGNIRAPYLIGVDNLKVS